MNILAAIKREEKKLEKQLKKVQHQLDGVRSAAKALGHTAAVEVKGVKKRVFAAIPSGRRNPLHRPVWHRPSLFLEQIRSKLILSGHYPKLSAVDRTA